MLIGMDIARAYCKVHANQDEEQIETSAPHDDVQCSIGGRQSICGEWNVSVASLMSSNLTKRWSGGVPVCHERDALCALCLTLLKGTGHDLMLADKEKEV